jgi:hypothetical protein
VCNSSNFFKVRPTVPDVGRDLGVDRLPFKEESEYLVKLNARLTKRLAVMVTAAACVSTLFVGTANAAFTNYTSATLTPSDPTANASGVTYTFALTGASATTAKCVKVQFGTSTAFGGVPSGMTITSSTVTLGAQQFTTTGSLSGDTISVNNSTGAASATSLTITNVHNPTSSGSLYAKITTFGDTLCTTPSQDLNTTTLATAITDNTTVSVTVDPSFTFTVGALGSACNGESGFVSTGTATTVALGNLAVSSTKSGGQTLSVAGNAGGGYAVYLRGLSAQVPKPMRNGSYQWADQAATYPSAAALPATGTEAFGFTWKDNVSAGTVPAAGAGNFVKLDATNRAVMDSDNTASSGTGCVSFAAQTGSSTPAGVYQATVIYTAVPVY